MRNELKLRPNPWLCLWVIVPLRNWAMGQYNDVYPTKMEQQTRKNGVKHRLRSGVGVYRPWERWGRRVLKIYCEPVNVGQIVIVTVYLGYLETVAIFPRFPLSNIIQVLVHDMTYGCYRPGFCQLRPIRD